MSAGPGDAVLDADAMVRAAEEATGLDDWGDPAWREGYDVLVGSLVEEAGLTEVGRLTFEHRLGHYLRQRLSVIDWRRRHPEIAATPIDGPVIIVGLPRTGTTALSNLLAADPATRSLRVWESASPTPPPEAATYHSDPRIAAAQAGIDTMEQMVPEMKAMHDDTATSTAEAIDLLGMSFRTHHFDGMAHVPTYATWWERCDMTPAYTFHREVLELVGWRCPPTRWHLKNPPDLFCLPVLEAVYPDVRFVWTHRRPSAVLPSVCSIMATVQEMSCAFIDRSTMGPRYTELWARGVEAAMEHRDAVGDDRFVDVHLDDLVADPVGTVASVYEAVGWDFTSRSERSVATWAARNPPGRHGDHRPDPDEFGLVPAAVDDRFAEYLDRFDPTGGDR